MNSYRRILWVDGIAGLLVGTLLLLAANWLDELYNISRELLTFIAIVNLAYGTYSFSLAIRKKRPLILITILVIANLAWSVNCLRLIFLLRDSASIFGLIQLAAEAIFVGGLAIIEWRYKVLLQTR